MHPTAGAALVVARGAEVLLQSIVGARQVGHVITRKETGPVTGADLEEVRHGWLHGAERGLIAAQLVEQGRQASSNLVARGFVGVGEQVGGALDPLIGGPDGRPERGRRREPLSDQRLESPQFGRQPPFSVSRLREASIAVSRSWSWSPDAHRGGRPSSVSALRTAKQ